MAKRASWSRSRATRSSRTSVMSTFPNRGNAPGAIATGLLPKSVPAWPAFGGESLALPWLGAALVGARVLYGIAVALFLLHWFGQLTAGWHRRGWLTAFIAIAIFATLGLGGAGL